MSVIILIFPNMNVKKTQNMGFMSNILKLSQILIGKAAIILHYYTFTNWWTHLVIPNTNTIDSVQLQFISQQ